MKKGHSGRLLLGTGLSLLLAACSPSSPPTASGDVANPYADGASYPWSYTAPSGQLGALSLTPGINTLYYEPLLAAHNGWGPIEINRSNGEQQAGDGRPLTLNGVVYKRGFGVHADSEMRYSLQGTGATCTTLTADIGLDDEVGSKGSVVFQIFLDGVKKYDSGKMTGASATEKVKVDLTGARELRMIVTNGGDSIDFDHADWANPQIVCVAAGTSTAPSVQFAQAQYTIFHKHSASLPVTFKNISGPVALRLEMSKTENVTASGLILNTTTLTLNGSEETRNIRISAPTLGEISPNLVFEDIVAPYQLIVSQNGRDIARRAVTLTEALLGVTTSFEPSTVTATAGGSGTTTLVVRVSPPLDQPVEIFADDTFLPSVYDQILQPLGPTYGDGGTMRRDYRINFAQIQPDGRPQKVRTVIFAGSPGGFAGYRLPGYGTSELYLNLIRPAP